MRLVLLLALLLILAPACAQANAATLGGRDAPTEQACSSPPTQPPSLHLQRDLVFTVWANEGYGGGVFRVSHGRFGLWWQGASGALMKNGDPMSADATFEIASVSKPFTAAVILLLAEEGALALDQPIGQLLPNALIQGLLVIDGHDYSADITVRQLLNHTSGLPDYWNDPPYIEPEVNAFLLEYLNDPNRLWNPKDILPYVRELTPIAAPGQKWHYSDTGYVLAGLIAEEVTGMALHELYRSMLFKPLGMNDTWLHWREPARGDRPRAHRYEGDWDMYDKRHNSADWAGGGLVSNTHDLEIFLRALARDDLFAQPGSAAAMQTWLPTGTPDIQYGLGLFRVELDDDLGEVWGHDGYGNSWMYYWPQQDVAFIGALNQTENEWWPLVEAAIVEISDIMAADPCLSTGPQFMPYIARS